MSEPASNDPFETAAASVMPEVELRIRAVFSRMPEPLRAMLAGFTAGIPGAAEVFGFAKLPPWVQELGPRVVKVLWPGIDDWNRPDTSIEDLGRGLGVIQATLMSIRCEEGKLFEPDGVLFGLPDSFGPAVKSFVETGNQLSDGQHNAFFRGFGEGLKQNLLSAVEVDGTLAVGSPRFLLYLILVALWPRVEGFKSTTELYDFLAKELGKGRLGDLATFQRRCRELGLYSRAGRVPRDRRLLPPPPA